MNYTALHNRIVLVLADDFGGVAPSMMDLVRALDGVRNSDTYKATIELETAGILRRDRYHPKRRKKSKGAIVLNIRKSGLYQAPPQLHVPPPPQQSTMPLHVEQPTPANQEPAGFWSPNQFLFGFACLAVGMALGFVGLDAIIEVLKE